MNEIKSKYTHLMITCCITYIIHKFSTVAKNSANAEEFAKKVFDLAEWDCFTAEGKQCLTDMLHCSDCVENVYKMCKIF